MKNKLLLILFPVALICNAQNKITDFEYQYDQEKTNAKGQRHGELLHSYDESIEYKHIYNDGKPVEATNYRISVAVKKPVVEKYKDGNPFRGFFIEKEEQSGTYKYTQYLDSKIVAKGNGLTLNSLKKLILSTTL